MGAKNWTKEEKQYLEENWGLYSVKTLAKKINRSINSIYVMKQRLHLGPFLESWEYVSFNQLLMALGIKSYSYKKTSWIKNRNFPVHKKKVNNDSFRVVYLDEFWKWADKNRTFIDWSKVEKNILGEEPDWVDAMRKVAVHTNRKVKKSPWTKSEDELLKTLINDYKYSYLEISEKLQRTEGAIIRRCIDLKIKGRPIKADNHRKWTEKEIETLNDLIVKRASYELIKDALDCRGTKAIKGMVYRLYGTENIDKAALKIEGRL